MTPDAVLASKARHARLASEATDLIAKVERNAAADGQAQPTARDYRATGIRAMLEGDQNIDASVWFVAAEIVEKRHGGKA